MRGFILWKPPANSSATSARTRIFSLFKDPNLASLSKTYWYGAYGRLNSLAKLIFGTNLKKTKRPRTVSNATKPVQHWLRLSRKHSNLLGHLGGNSSSNGADEGSPLSVSWPFSSRRMLQYLSEVEMKLKQDDEWAPERKIEQRNPSLVRNTSSLSRVITKGIEHTSNQSPTPGLSSRLWNVYWSIFFDSWSRASLL